MKQILLLLLFLCPTFGKKENLDDLSSLLNDPELLSELEKRFGNLFDDSIEDEVESEPEVGCYALKGTLNGDCDFHTNGSTIIKTTESIANKALYITNIANVSCARDCTAECCKNEKCDTSVYQDKKEHNCYLFQCGHPSKCVFVHHGDYWMSSSSKEVHKSHTYRPGGATQSHENELANLGNQDEDSVEVPTTPKPVKTTTAPKPTTPRPKPVTTKPGLDEFCSSYDVECADPHGECLMEMCRCRVGYHKKHGVCRKHCRDEEYECENISYGKTATHCIDVTDVCNGKKDCDFGSDEEDCPPVKDDKSTYQDSDPSSNIYNNPLYNLPYGNQPDNQYPYGFPIPGLTNQQQAGLLQSNQLYPSQIQPSGQYYIPGLTNQNAVAPPASNQLGTQQWPYIDKNVGIGSQIYPNTNQVYQPVQQPNYLSPQTGNYVPIVQNPVVQNNPVKVPVQISPNIQQPVQIVPSQNLNPPVVQQVNPVVVNNPVTQAPVTNIQLPDKSAIQAAQEIGQDHNEMNKQVLPDEAYTALPPTLAKTIYNSGAKFVKTEDTVDSRNDYYDDTTVGNRLPGMSMFDNMMNVDTGKTDNGNTPTDNVNNGKAAGRHSAEVDDEQFYQKPKTYPPATKAKTQIGTPTQSTAAGQRHSQSHSEGFPDYSWVNYESKKPRISGKKGTVFLNNKDDSHKDIGSKQRTKIQVQDNAGKMGTRKPASNDNIPKQGNDNRQVPSTKYDDRTSEGNYDYDLDRYPGRFSDDYLQPVSGNHRPLYDRYRDNNRRRPGHGSRYPYYDTGYGRSRDRNPPYPVWDKFRDEYYYPEDSFEGDGADMKHDINYDDITGGRPGDQGSFNKDDKHKVGRPGDQGSFNKDDKHKGMPPTVKVTVTEAPGKAASTADLVMKTGKQPTVTDAAAPQAVNPDDSDSQEQGDVSSESLETDNSKKESKETDSDSTDNSESNNNTDSSQETSDDYQPFRILNAEQVEVSTFSDNSQGPIVALALGLAITMMLLIFVGCRLRTVKRRLRKGRALHSNEADYLINGMYL